MKKISIMLGLIFLIGCGGGEKKVADKPVPTAAPQYTFVSPKQAMLDNGKAVYDKACFICHKDGVGGAAAITNLERWTANRAKDLPTMIEHVNDGYTGEYGTMTPKGTCMDCSKDDLRDAIFFMMVEAGVLE